MILQYIPSVWCMTRTYIIKLEYFLLLIFRSHLRFIKTLFLINWLDYPETENRYLKPHHLQGLYQGKNSALHWNSEALKYGWKSQQSHKCTLLALFHNQFNRTIIWATAMKKISSREVTSYPSSIRNSLLNASAATYRQSSLPTGTPTFVFPKRFWIARGLNKRIKFDIKKSSLK